MPSLVALEEVLPPASGRDAFEDEAGNARRKSGSLRRDRVEMSGKGSIVPTMVRNKGDAEADPPAASIADRTPGRRRSLGSTGIARVSAMKRGVRGPAAGATIRSPFNCRSRRWMSRSLLGGRAPLQWRVMFSRDSEPLARLMSLSEPEGFAVHKSKRRRATGVGAPPSKDVRHGGHRHLGSKPRSRRRIRAAPRPAAAAQQAFTACTSARAALRGFLLKGPVPRSSASWLGRIGARGSQRKRSSSAGMGRPKHQAHVLQPVDEDPA